MPASPFTRRSAAACISGPPPTRREQQRELALVEFGGFLVELIAAPVPEGAGCIPHFAVYVDDVDQAAADLRAAGVDTFQTAEKCVMPNTFGGLENWFFTGPSGEQIELLKML